jgi:hypothetical protein
MYVAHMESLKKSDRGKHAWKTARDHARGSGMPHMAAPPCWVEKANGGYRLLPDRAAAMRRAVQLALDGYGIQATCRELVKAKVPAPNRSRRWNEAFLWDVFRGRTLLGEYQPTRDRAPDGPPIPGYYPALLEEEEWLLLRAAVEGRRLKRGRPTGADRVNLFTGIAEDAEGRPLSLFTQAHGGGTWVYLGRRGAGATRVRYDEVEDTILDVIALLRPEDVQEPVARNAEREARIAALTARQVVLDQRIRSRGRELDSEDNESLREELKGSIRRMGDELVEVNAELKTLKLESLTGRTEALSFAQTLRKLYNDAKGDERRELGRRIKAALPSVVIKIVVLSKRVSPRKAESHVRIFLRGGESRTALVLPGGCKPPHRQHQGC